MRRRVFVAVGTAAVMVVMAAGSAAAQVPCSAEVPDPNLGSYPVGGCAVDAGAASATCVSRYDAPDLYSYTKVTSCQAATADGAAAVAAQCTRDWAGFGYYSKDTTCSAAAAGATAACHRDYEAARGVPSNPDEIDCTASGSGAAATCTRNDAPSASTERSVEDDCSVDAAGVQRDAHLSEGPLGPAIPDDPL